MAGKRLLVVEDDYLTAQDMAQTLRKAGAEILGPVGTVAAALRLLDAEAGRLDGAVLDINLRNERVYPVANALSRRGVPFVFVTGYGRSAVLGLYAGIPLFEKPLDPRSLAHLLAAA